MSDVTNVSTKAKAKAAGFTPSDTPKFEIPRFDLPKFDMWLLLGLTGYALYDWMVNQGEEYRSSTLRAHEAAAAGASFVPPGYANTNTQQVQQAVPGLLAKFATLGLRRILLPQEDVIIDVDPAGGFTFDLPKLSESRLLALAGQALTANPTTTAA